MVMNAPSNTALILPAYSYKVKVPYLSQNMMIAF